MQNSRIKRFIALFVLLSVAALAQASIPPTQPHDNDRAPDLPSGCESLQVQAGHRLAYHSYAVGVQSYRWNGTAWVFVEPVATLFGDPSFHNKDGVHYLGPTWESNRGGKVVAARVAGCTPDASAIPWLLLQAVTTAGPGVFGETTFIQRVNTKGGLIPTAPGSTIGAVADVPYTAEYYFYRARD